MIELLTNDLVKLSAYVILLIPGFIFVQTLEHHLLRERKPQFEKTLEILLSSAFIWAVSLSVPLWWPYGASRDRIIEILTLAVNHQVALSVATGEIAGLGKDSATFFFVICIWTFVVANVWGMIRKKRSVDAIIKTVTGRDWFPSVPFRFFQENLNKPIEVTAGDKRYLGILYSAPDSKDDRHIIIINPLLINEKRRRIENLPLTKEIMFDLEKVSEVKSLSPSILKGSQKE